MCNSCNFEEQLLKTPTILVGLAVTVADRKSSTRQWSFYRPQRKRQRKEEGQGVHKRHEQKPTSLWCGTGKIRGVHKLGCPKKSDIGLTFLKPFDSPKVVPSHVYR